MSRLTLTGVVLLVLVLAWMVSAWQDARQLARLPQPTAVSR